MPLALLLQSGGQSFNRLSLGRGAASASGGPPRAGLQVLGKIGRSKPRGPVALASIKKENFGLDPSVEIVPSGGAGWGGNKQKIPLGQPQSPAGERKAPEVAPEPEPVEGAPKREPKTWGSPSTKQERPSARIDPQFPTLGQQPQQGSDAWGVGGLGGIGGDRRGYGAGYARAGQARGPPVVATNSVADLASSDAAFRRTDDSWAADGDDMDFGENPFGNVPPSSDLKTNVEHSPAQSSEQSTVKDVQSVDKLSAVADFQGSREEEPLSQKLGETKGSISSGIESHKADVDVSEESKMTSGWTDNRHKETEDLPFQVTAENDSVNDVPNGSNNASGKPQSDPALYSEESEQDKAEMRQSIERARARRQQEEAEREEQRKRAAMAKLAALDKRREAQITSAPVIVQQHSSVEHGQRGPSTQQQQLQVQRPQQQQQRSSLLESQKHTEVPDQILGLGLGRRGEGQQRKQLMMFQRGESSSQSRVESVQTTAKTANPWGEPATVDKNPWTSVTDPPLDHEYRKHTQASTQESLPWADSAPTDHVAATFAKPLSVEEAERRPPTTGRKLFDPYEGEKPPKSAKLGKYRSGTTTSENRDKGRKGQDSKGGTDRNVRVRIKGQGDNGESDRGASQNDDGSSHKRDGRRADRNGRSERKLEKPKKDRSKNNKNAKQEAKIRIPKNAKKSSVSSNDASTDKRGKKVDHKNTATSDVDRQKRKGDGTGKGRLAGDKEHQKVNHNEKGEIASEKKVTKGAQKVSGMPSEGDAANVGTSARDEAKLVRSESRGNSPEKEPPAAPKESAWAKPLITLDSVSTSTVSSDVGDTKDSQDTNKGSRKEKRDRKGKKEIKGKVAGDSQSGATVHGEKSENKGDDSIPTDVSAPLDQSSAAPANTMQSSGEQVSQVEPGFRLPAARMASIWATSSTDAAVASPLTGSVVPPSSIWEAGSGSGSSSAVPISSLQQAFSQTSVGSVPAGPWNSNAGTYGTTTPGQVTNQSGHTATDASLNAGVPGARAEVDPAIQQSSDSIASQNQVHAQLRSQHQQLVSQATPSSPQQHLQYYSSATQYSSNGLQRALVVPGGLQVIPQPAAEYTLYQQPVVYATEQTPYVAAAGSVTTQIPDHELSVDAPTFEMPESGGHPQMSSAASKTPVQGSPAVSGAPPSQGVDDRTVQGLLNTSPATAMSAMHPAYVNSHSLQMQPEISTQAYQYSATKYVQQPLVYASEYGGYTYIPGAARGYESAAPAGFGQQLQNGMQYAPSINTPGSRPPVSVGAAETKTRSSQRGALRDDLIPHLNTAKIVGESSTASSDRNTGRSSKTARGKKGHTGTPAATTLSAEPSPVIDRTGDAKPTATTDTGSSTKAGPVTPLGVPGPIDQRGKDNQNGKREREILYTFRSAGDTESTTASTAAVSAPVSRGRGRGRGGRGRGRGLGRGRRPVDHANKGELESPDAANK